MSEKNSNRMDSTDPSSKKSLEQFSHMTVSTTPFTLAEDDSVSTSFSTTEGIDILGSSQPSPRNFYEWSHQRSGRIVTSQLFKRCVLGMILVNSLVLGLRTYYWRDGFESFLNGTVYFFLILFTLEQVPEILHHQHKILHKGWIIFDIIVIILSWSLSTTLTIFRAFRLIRAFRKRNGVADLKSLVKALLKVIPKMLAVLFLLLILFYIFSVLFTDFFKGLYLDYPNAVSEDYFGRLDTTALTLFQIMTFGRLWSVAAGEIMQVYPWSWMLFVAFVCTAIFFFMSLIFAIMGEAVTAVSQDRIWKSLDTRGSGTPTHPQPVQPPVTSPPIVEEQDSNKSLEMKRLEEKIDALGATVDQLMRMQVTMQESLNRLTQQEMARALSTRSGPAKDAKEDDDDRKEVHSVS